MSLSNRSQDHSQYPNNTIITTRIGGSSSNIGRGARSRSKLTFNSNVSTSWSRFKMQDNSAKPDFGHLPLVNQTMQCNFSKMNKYITEKTQKRETSTTVHRSRPKLLVAKAQQRPPDKSDGERRHPISAARQIHFTSLHAKSLELIATRPKHEIHESEIKESLKTLVQNGSLSNMRIEN